MKPDKIIAGLGNPGRQYRDTRHNIGYMVLAELAKRHAFDKPRRQFNAEICDARIGGKNILLLSPTTFMNLSGNSVTEAIRFFKLNPATDLVVACDDLDLPAAQLRFRESGGAGGQKGLKDIVAKLGTQNFARLRVGIGRPSSPDQVVNYVLSPFRKDERLEIDVAIREAADALQLWVERGAQEVMNKYNVAGKSPSKGKKGTRD
ncbi:MAG: aminoacyl-tRNA hydrolase [Thermoguttaceae bacterium]|jgi:PTH1 family peptidyl-tRNA hydrolase